MTSCPRCGYMPTSASHDAFTFFHVIVDAYARALQYRRDYAKHELCVDWGIAVPYEGQPDLPKWPMVPCRVRDIKYVRKSTTAYTKDEMNSLIESATEAVYEAGGELPARGGENV